MKAILQVRIDRAPIYLSLCEKMRWLFVILAVCFAATSSFGITFPADPASLGGIPDSDLTSPTCQNASTTFKDVTFTVTGLPGSAFVVAVSFSASHTYLQDLEVSLRAPGGSPSHLLFSATGTTSTVVGTCAGSSNDLSTANTYTFADTATVNWWTRAATNPVPTGSNRTVVTGIGGTTNPPATTNMTTTFFSAPANGTWTLRFRDRGAGDTGTVTAASLTLMGPEPPLHNTLDFNGDGKTDWVVTRNTGGGANGQLTWYVQNNGVAGGQIVPWGLQTDVATPGDFDGDGKTDLVVYRPGNGTWYTRYSSAGYSYATYTARQWGLPGDTPLVMDIDDQGQAFEAGWKDAEARIAARTTGKR